MTKELLIKVTAKDCKWDYYKGSGAGGQKKNKTSSAVRCKHKPSGAVGQCEEHRSQKQNKQLAFRRMAESKEFQNWIRLTVAKITGAEAEARSYAEHEMNSDRIKIEVKKDGKWVSEEDNEVS